ncbi:chromate transporter, partial [Bdellovibrionota bacterium FG-2]
GNWGGLLAGICFILPAFLLVLGASVAYVHFGGVPQNLPFFQGLQVGALVAIGISVFSLGAPFWRRPRMWAIAALAGLAVFLHPLWEPVVIVFLGESGVAFSEAQLWGWSKKMPAVFFVGGLSSGLNLPLIFPTLGALLWVCFKGGAFLFGSGLAIVPMLEAEVVQRFHWLTHSEFLDGIAIGQLTPGPLLMTVTFVGYKVAGLLGACLATFGVFFPAFFLVLGILPVVSRWLSAGVGAKRAAVFSEWTIYAVLGAIFSATVRLGRFTLVTPVLGWSFILVLGLGYFFSFRKRVLPVWSLLPIAGCVVALLN